MAAAKNNDYSSKNNRLWADTLRRACIQGDGKKIRAIAEALICKATEGDVAAIKELGDRLDGKATQALTLGGPDGEALNITINLGFRAADAGR